MHHIGQFADSSVLAHQHTYLLYYAGIEYDERKGVTVDENFMTTVKGIYAIGDVNGKQMLAHAAEVQAIHAVNLIIGKEDCIDFSIMPAAIFTQPEAACVGPTEDQLKEQGVAYEFQ